MHADLDHLAFLMGTWRGAGRGGYATIDPFDYGEEMTFTFHGEPWLAYEQRAWSADDETILHMERGFVRPAPGGGVELVLAHPIGVVEVAHGSVAGGTIEVATTPGSVGRSQTGLDVIGLIRRYTVSGDVMGYRIDMATEIKPMAVHLTAELRRVT